MGKGTGTYIGDLHEEKHRLVRLGYDFNYSAYGITVFFDGQKIFDAPKTFGPGLRVEQHEAMERLARYYLMLGVQAAQKHEKKDG